MLEINNLTFSYKKKLVFKNINFNVNPGEIVSILGLNGSGKSTLLKTIAKIEIPEKGSIYIDSQNIMKLKGKELAKKIGYLPQKSNGEYITVYDAILLGRKIFFKLNPSNRDYLVVDKIIDLLNIKKIASKFTNELSGGELQKVFIARALVQEPKILLLDEPINHLDIFSKIEIMELIKNIVKSKNLIALIVLHDLNFALNYSDKFLLLKNKTIYGSGVIKNLNENLIKEVFNIKVKILKEDNKIFIITNGLIKAPDKTGAQ